MRISDWSSDVCSSDLKQERMPRPLQRAHEAACASQYPMARSIPGYRIFSPVAELKSQTLKSDCPRYLCQSNCVASEPATLPRSEEQTSELQSLMRISYAVFRLKKKNNK